MAYKTLSIAAVCAAAAFPAFAQVTGGQIGLSYSLPTDNSNGSVTEYHGGIEYSINRQFAIAGDLSGYSFENVDQSFISTTVHFIYHLSDTGSVGFFAGQDTVGDLNAGLFADATVFGLEAGGEFNEAEVEGYFARVNGGNSDVTLFGAEGLYSFDNGFGAIAEVGMAQSDVGDFNKIAVGGTYTIQGGPDLYAQIGQRSFDGGSNDANSTFIEIGGTLQFGTQRGTTFNKRSLFELLPNF